MPKRLQVIFTDEAWMVIDRVSSEACDGFEVGSISYSDVINELVLNAKIDIRTLQLKHTDFRRSLKKLATQSNVDLDGAIRSLMDLKTKTLKRQGRQSGQETHTND